jgi:hypothetical protein
MTSDRESQDNVIITLTGVAIIILSLIAVGIIRYASSEERQKTGYMGGIPGRYVYMPSGRPVMETVTTRPTLRQIGIRVCLGTATLGIVLSAIGIKVEILNRKHTRKR